MKKMVITSIVLLFSSSLLFAGECEDLMKKYDTPDPAMKTMKQLKRWVKRKVKDSNKEKLEECLVSRAADNPNKATVAGN